MSGIKEAGRRKVRSEKKWAKGDTENEAIIRFGHRVGGCLTPRWDPSEGSEWWPVIIFSASSLPAFPF